VVVCTVEGARCVVDDERMAAPEEWR
jgi:hypothetical protein